MQDHLLKLKSNNPIDMLHRVMRAAELLSVKLGFIHIVGEKQCVE